MSSPNTKKAKTSEEEAEFLRRRAEVEALRRYILRCPPDGGEEIGVAADATTIRLDGPAVRAALSGLDDELKRIDRDKRLRRKFAAEADAVAATTRSTETSDSGVGGGRRSNPATLSAEASGGGTAIGGEEDLDSSLMEWQDVREPSSLISPVGAVPVDVDSALGRRLATAAIGNMAAAGTKVASPLAAIALALHATLRSDVLSFRCTGVPDDEASTKKKGGGGFAAPIRELPRSVFVAKGWDANPRSISLRYRKDGVGAAVLRVSLLDSAAGVGLTETVTVRFAPVGAAEEPGGPGGDSLTFPLDEHVNLDGLGAALRKEPSGVPPALHYKRLAGLLTRFTAAFDLGSVHDEEAEGEAEASSEVPVMAVPPLPVSIRSSRPTIDDATGGADGLTPPALPSGPRPIPASGRIPSGDDRPRIDDLVRPRPNGDFADDLTPGGIRDPHLGRPGEGGGGSLMGPNHPIFQGDGYYQDDDEDGLFQPQMPGVGGLGMRPRFDPYGPPGGPSDPNFPGPGRGVGGPGRGGLGRGRGGRGGRGRGRAPPGGWGDPNPDHQVPPNDLGAGGNNFI